MEFWKIKDECRVIKRVETLDEIKCNQCGKIITMDSTDDTYIRATTTVFYDHGNIFSVYPKDLCRKCAIELVTREFLSHNNPNMGFSVDIRHLRTRNERTVEENVDTHEQVEGPVL